MLFIDKTVVGIDKQLNYLTIVFDKQFSNYSLLIYYCYRPSVVLIGVFYYEYDDVIKIPLQNSNSHLYR